MKLFNGKLDNMQEEVTLLEQCVQWITVFGFPFIILQVFLFQKDMKSRFDYQKREKAVEMAREFQELISEIYYFNVVLKKTDLESIMKKVNYNQLQYFDVEEAKSIFTEKEIEQLKEITIPEKLGFKNLADAHIMANINDYRYQKFYDKLLKNEYNPYQNPSVEEEVNFNNDYFFYLNKFNIEYGARKLEVLNKLEYIAMYFSNDIASEKIVYQSLHQVFLKIILFFYYDIAQMNDKGSKDKYYCNIIKLYCKWSGEYHKVLEREKSFKRKGLRMENRRVI